MQDQLSREHEVWALEGEGNGTDAENFRAPATKMMRGPSGLSV
jgi:hypothetical protein